MPVSPEIEGKRALAAVVLIRLMVGAVFLSGGAAMVPRLRPDS